LKGSDSAPKCVTFLSNFPDDQDVNKRFLISSHNLWLQTAFDFKISCHCTKAKNFSNSQSYSFIPLCLQEQWKTTQWI